MSFASSLENCFLEKTNDEEKIRFLKTVLNNGYKMYHGEQVRSYKDSEEDIAGYLKEGGDKTKDFLDKVAKEIGRRGKEDFGLKMEQLFRSVCQEWLMEIGLLVEIDKR